MSSTDKYRSFSLAIWISVGLVVSIWLISRWADLYSDPVLEAGDSAANSLLVLEAKNFSLLVGNYSRLGFNHPGPALLYMFAFGEWFFYDLFGFASSPIIGQAMGTAVYVGTWIALIGFLLERLLADRIAAVTALAVFCAILMAYDGNFLGSMWFPYLYPLPFIAFVLGCLLLVRGEYRVFGVWCLSVGVLVHGHASFIVICGLVTVGSVLLRRHFAQLTLLGVFLDGWQKNRNDLYCGFAVLTIFALPVVLNTLVHFPGELPKYISYGSSADGNGWEESFKFLMHAWGGYFVAFAGAIVTAMISFSYGSVGKRPPWLDFGAVILLTSFVVLFYIKRGVDDLAPINTYTVFFFFPVLALVFSLALVITLLRLDFVSTVVRNTSLAFILSCSLWIASKLAWFGGVHHMPEANDVASRLRSNAGDVVVIHADNTGNWSEAWSGVAAILVSMARGGDSNVCVSTGWTIAFTRERKCADKQYMLGRHYVVGSVDGKVASMPGAERFGRLVVAPQVVPRVGREAPWRVSSDSGVLLKEGWSSLTENTAFVWSVGSAATLSLWTNDADIEVIDIDAGAYLPLTDSVQRVRVSVAVGHHFRQLGEAVFSAENPKPSLRFELPPGAISREGVIYIKFEFVSPISPRSVGHSEDDRLLGLALRGVSLN